MIGYHFVGETLRDGRPIPPDCEWLTYNGPVIPCRSGLHMSEEPYDALKYAPGATLCKVELRGDVVSHGNPVDKYVGRERMILARFDATHLLRRFAADQALSVKHLWKMPEIVERYLTTLDESLRDVARDAARDAASSTASNAAWAARAATENAAWQATWQATWWASGGEWDARREFNRRVYEALNYSK